jgi:hypothetical protein
VLWVSRRVFFTISEGNITSSKEWLRLDSPHL